MDLHFQERFGKWVSLEAGWGSRHKNLLEIPNLPARSNRALAAFIQSFIYDAMR